MCSRPHLQLAMMGCAGLTCGSLSDDYLTRNRLSAAQWKRDKSGNKPEWMGGWEEGLLKGEFTTKRRLTEKFPQRQNRWESRTLRKLIEPSSLLVLADDMSAKTPVFVISNIRIKPQRCSFGVHDNHGVFVLHMGGLIIATMGIVSDAKRLQF